MEAISNVSVFDYSGHKLCDLYDEQVSLKGQAYDIEYVQNWDGVPKLTFSIPYMVNDEENFRWKYLKNEYLIRLYYNSENIWFIANKPVKKKGKEIIGTVSCDGTPILLKTKNIYKAFDDENGIGTVDYIMEQVLAGSGWHLGYCEVLKEKDGVTDKVRSLNSSGSKGALGLINDVCNLFQCRPVYHTDTKTVDIIGRRTRDMIFEAEVGRNLDALSVQNKSDDIVTRMYVEGEYGDDGYVGIDDVNPTGLSYLFNFDYYRETGLFRQEHEEALATYLEDIQDVNQRIKSVQGQINEIEGELNTMIGQCVLTVYYVSNGFDVPMYLYGDPTAEQQAIAPGDEVIIMNSDGTHRYETVVTTAQALVGPGDYAVGKFAKKASGKIGAQEVQIEAKEKEIDNLTRKIAATTKEDRIAEYQHEIARLQSEINVIYYGASASDQEMIEEMAEGYIPVGYDGNVDLTNRIIVPAQTFINAGYTDFDGDYGTIYSLTYSAGKREEFDYEYTQNVIIDVTPVKADGSVITRVNVEGYIEHLISVSEQSGRSLMAIDGEERNILLRVLPIRDMELDQAYSEDGDWCAALHEMQASWDETRARCDFFGDSDTIDPAGIFDDTERLTVLLYIQRHSAFTHIAIAVDLLRQIALKIDLVQLGAIRDRLLM